VLEWCAAKEVAVRAIICGIGFFLLAGPSASFAQALPDKFFDANGVRIRYVEQGTGVAIVLVPGYMIGLEPWLRTGIFSDLARDHRVVAYDIRGQGKSDKPHDPAAYRGELTADVVRLMGHLGVPKAHIVGYSLGAIIAAKLLTEHPEQFLTATLGGRAGLRGFTLETQREIDETAAELESDVPFRSFVQIPQGQAPPDDAEMRRLSAVAGGNNDPKALAAYWRGGRKSLYTTDAEIASTRVPVLGVVGSLDDVDQMKALKTLLPAMSLVVIDGATHVSAPRQPAFLQAIRSFITSHE